MIYQKAKEGIRKSLKKATKIFLKKKKRKSTNMLVSDIEIFLKMRKKKKRQYGHEQYKNLLDYENQNLVEYIKN